MVDAVDNLQMTGQNVLQHAAWPTFKGFGQNGVVGVGEGSAADFPGLKKEEEESIFRSVDRTHSKACPKSILVILPSPTPFPQRRQGYASVRG